MPIQNYIACRLDELLPWNWAKLPEHRHLAA